MTKNLVTLALVGLLSVSGCAQHCANDRYPYACAPSYPYGSWRSASGYSIEVRRNDTYSVCYGGECDDGPVEYFGRFGVRLKEFSTPDNDVARDVLRLSGYEENWRIIGRDPAELRDLDFTPNVSPSALGELCNNRPCVALGARERPNYTFILEEDRR